MVLISKFDRSAYPNFLQLLDDVGLTVQQRSSFQSENTRYVMVIRGEKYKTYWDESYFVDMLETIILNVGSAEAETIILARN